MPSSSVTELQQKLFRRMGIDGLAGQDQRPLSGTKRSKSLSRKEERKVQRAQKKSQRHSKLQAPATRIEQRNYSSLATPHKTQTKRPKRPSLRQWERGDSPTDETTQLHEGSDGDLSEVGNCARNSTDALQGTIRKDGLPAAVQDRFTQDDAEIENLERKLGIKKGRKTLPKAFKDDGLDEILGTLRADSPVSDDNGNKRKRFYDEWLSSKRRKKDPELHDGVALRGISPHTGASGSLSDYTDGAAFRDDETENSDLDMSSGSFNGFDSETEAKFQIGARARENPYVAPKLSAMAAKYTPPSLRKTSSPGDEARGRLRKQIQGQINRLTDSNIISIVDAIEKLYQQNARGDVTDVLTDAIMAQICKPESLPDQFFVLIGGLSGSVYKIVGSSFGSHLVRRLVNDFGREYDRASSHEASNGSAAIQKEASNIMTLLTQLYSFEVVTCRVLFDYMERFLDVLSEVNVELLLRVCRMVGPLLRKDDPQAIRHVSETLTKSIAKIGYANASVRTKFMLETINDLKNNRPKAKGMDSDVVLEQVLRMRKRLGELKSQSRRLDGLSPMGMSLDDVEGADNHGMWWLVGASVPSYRGAAERARGIAKDRQERLDVPLDDEDMDLVLPDFPKKARAQGLSTAAQIAIFTSLLSANSHEHGYRQFLHLKLKKDDQLEIARVLVQCVGSETQYNKYYAMVGRLACQNGRVRFALQDRLWKIFRSLGESLFGDDADNEETSEGERMRDERRIGNVARFYASLVADGALGIGILKPLELPKVNRWASLFVERFLISLLQSCQGKGSREDANIQRVFGPAREVTTLAAGIHWFLRKTVRQSVLIGAQEGKKLRRIREAAQAVVQAVGAEDSAPVEV